MTSRYAGQTIDGLLNDPMTRAVMRADHLDPATVRAMLHSMAQRLQAVQHATGPARPAARRTSVTFDRRVACWP